MALDPAKISQALVALWTENPASGLSSPLTTQQLAMIQAQADAIAQAVTGEVILHKIGADEIEPGSLTDLHFSDTAELKGFKLAPLAISNRELGNNAVAGGNVAPGELRDGHIADDADIHGDKLGAGTVKADRVATKAQGSAGFTSDHFADDAGIQDGQLAPSGFSFARFDADQVQDGQIAGVGAAKVEPGLVASQISSVNPSSLTGSGKVPLAGLGGVTSAQLATSLRRNTKCVVDAGTEPTCTRTAAIPFGGEGINDGYYVVDTLQEMTKSPVYDTFAPAASEVARLRVQVHARGSFITLGCRGQLMVQDVTAAVAVASSRWRAAEVAPDGTVEIVVEIDEQISVTTGHGYRAFLTVVDRDGAPFASAATIKGRDPSSGVAGSFFEVVGVPND